MSAAAPCHGVDSEPTLSLCSTEPVLQTGYHYEKTLHSHNTLHTRVSLQPCQVILPNWHQPGHDGVHDQHLRHHAGGLAPEQHNSSSSNRADEPEFLMVSYMFIAWLSLADSTSIHRWLQLLPNPHEHAATPCRANMPRPKCCRGICTAGPLVRF